MKRRLPFIAVLTAISTAALAYGAADNQPDSVRRIPPPGLAISASDRSDLQALADELGKEIERLESALKAKPALSELLPDVRVYHKAVQWALTFDEFYRTNEVAIARNLLRQGLDRAQALGNGQAPWAAATGLVVRAYVSKIDGSIQPYGLIVPASYAANPTRPHRLDAWFHGRGENLTELAFINERQRSPGEFVPPNAFVLHLYGRYCNANKFAGEMDLFEALDHVRKHYPIDENRLVVRGFSMGGAACWQFAVHYAGLWAAAAPGAGFSETPDFLRVFQNEAVKPTWFEQKLWHWYDCTDYAINLFNCPTVAYSGEIDRQKQAADMMAKAMAAEGMELTHIIGPKTAHRYHPESKLEINRRIDSIVERGRNPVPTTVRFTTWTLRYNRMFWVTVDGLEEHWSRARVDAQITDNNSVAVKTANVSALTLAMPAGQCPLDPTRRPKLVIDGRELEAAPVLSDRSWTTHLKKAGDQWAVVPTAQDEEIRKRPGLQGPIDDAFLDSFIMVSPTGQPLNREIGSWVASEQAHAVDHWRRQFRGDTRLKADTDVIDADIANNNLVLWGDPQSNSLLSRIASKLPIAWDAQGVRLSGTTYSPAHHALIMVFPNPLNPKRYVVLNSGFTFREYDYLNNARQVAKLPDYAIVDIRVPVSSRAPGGIADAGFFGERWELKAARQ